MKRHWVTSLTILFTLAEQAFAQAPASDPMPVSAGPGRAIVVSPMMDGEQPKSGTEQLPSAAAPVQTSTNCNFDGATQKTPLIDTHTGPPDQLWFRASYLYWHIQDMPIPQVIATITTPGGQTTIGNTNVSFDWSNGGRLEGGMWFGCDHTHGIEFGGFLLQRVGREYAFSGTGQPGSATIVRPVTDPVANAQLDVIVAAPGVAGQLLVNAQTQLGSAEISFTRNLAYNECFQFDSFAGFRYIDLTDNLEIASDSRALAGTPFVMNGSTPDFNRLTVTDSFTTRNQLYLGQIGARATFYRGMWFGGVRGSVAVGPSQQTMEIAGESAAFTPAGGRAGGAGGLLAVPGGPVIGSNPPATLPAGNAGTYRTDWFVVAPEVGLQAGAQLSRFTRVFVGYNFLYINNVVRPGDVIDTVVNRKYLPYSVDYGNQSGANRPALRDSRDDFIAHGVEFGVHFTF